MFFSWVQRYKHRQFELCFKRNYLGADWSALLARVMLITRLVSKEAMLWPEINHAGAGGWGMFRENYHGTRASQMALVVKNLPGNSGAVRDATQGSSRWTPGNSFVMLHLSAPVLWCCHFISFLYKRSFAADALQPCWQSPGFTHIVSILPHSFLMSIHFSSLIPCNILMVVFLISIWFCITFIVSKIRAKMANYYSSVPKIPLRHVFIFTVLWRTRTGLSWTFRF